MPAPNQTTAQSQLAIMEQVINSQVETTQNLDTGIDKVFQQAGAMDMGKEKYRHPILIDVGGQAGTYDPDGGTYFPGTGPEYNQFLVVPIPIMIAVAATELLERISKSEGLMVVNPIAKMVATVKAKMAHTRNALAQGYNQLVLGTVDTSYAGGSVVPLANNPFGNRLLDLNNIYAATDASGNFNVIGSPTVLSKSNSTGGTIDTVTLDAAPAGLVAGSSLLLMSATSGAPLGPDGMQYLISTSNVGDQNGLSRALPQVQVGGVNANSATLTLGMIEAARIRQLQLLGNDDVQKNRLWYTHNIQQVTARLLGFAKLLNLAENGKQPNFDISPDRYDRWMIGGQEAMTDSMAAINTLYDVCKSYLKKVRYPGSQKFIPGTINGYWWPRYNQGQATSERDMYYQDAYNMYTNLPWSHSVINSVGVVPAMAVAI